MDLQSHQWRVGKHGGTRWWVFKQGDSKDQHKHKWSRHQTVAHFLTSMMIIFFCRIFTASTAFKANFFVYEENSIILIGKFYAAWDRITNEIINFCIQAMLSQRQSYNLFRILKPCTSSVHSWRNKSSEINRTIAVNQLQSIGIGQTILITIIKINENQPKCHFIVGHRFPSTVIDYYQFLLIIDFVNCVRQCISTFPWCMK